MLFKSILNALSLLLIVACCFSVSAQTDESTAGTITGSVVGESGQPLTGAVVYVRSVNAVALPRTARTDANGNFRVKDLEPVLYSISTVYPAYVTQPVDPNSANYVRAGDTVRIEMVRGAVITGTVTNAAGEPLIGVRVRALQVRNAKGDTPRYGIAPFQERQTDDRGIYRMFGLPAGTYLVSAGGMTNPQNFVLNPYDVDVPTYAPSSTRDNAAEITVGSGDESLVDIHYRGDAGHSVSGTVKMSGVSNASVILTPVGSLLAVSTTAQLRGSRGFAFYGVADGDYDVVAQEATSTTLGVTPTVFISEAQRIRVKGADVGGLELVTRSLALISGRITLEPAKVPECQGKRQPLFAEMVVNAQRPQPQKYPGEATPYLRVFSSPASPDPSGNFALRNLAPGRYQLEPRFFARYWYLSSISNGANPRIDPAANWTTLKSGDQLTNFTITLAGGAASIRGRVASDARVASDVGVYLIPAEREKAADVLRYFVTSVAADGTFAFNSVPPGPYLSLVRTLDADASAMSKLRSPDAAEARAKLRRAAETQNARLELKPCQSLTDLQLARQ